MHLISSLELEKEDSTYKIFTGQKAGLYYSIGNFLEQQNNSHENEINSENINLHYKIINDSSTNGGFDNVVKVLSNSKSFGIIQETSINKNDDLREQIQYITPLYMERMHVLYNYDEFKKNSTDSEVPVLSSDLHYDTKVFFQEGNINMGPIGSGSQVISNLLLNELNIKCKKTMTEPHDSAKKMMREKKINVMFFIGGAPLALVSELLNDTSSDIRLMSINPEAILKVNLKYNMHFRFTDFKSKYTFTDKTKAKKEKLERVSTLGTLSYLVASKNTSSKAILNLLQVLNDRKQAFKNTLIKDLPYSNFISPLDEMDFVTSYQTHFGRLSNELDNKKWWRLYTYYISLVLALFFLLTWLASFWNRHKYLKDLATIYNEKLTRSEELNTENKPYLTTNEYDGTSKIIMENAILGVQDIFNLLKETRMKYTDGGLTDQHYKFLTDKMKEGLNDFRNLFARRLYKSICKEEELPENFIENHYIGGFIKNEDLDRLFKLK